MAFIYKQPLQHAILPTNVSKELQNLPNNKKNKNNDPALLNIPLGLKDLLKVFLGRQAHILLQNLKYNHIINLQKGRQLHNFFIYNFFHKELKILQKYFNSLLEKG